MDKVIILHLPLLLLLSKSLEYLAHGRLLCARACPLDAGAKEAAECASLVYFAWSTWSLLLLLLIMLCNQRANSDKRANSKPTAQEQRE